MHEMLYGHHSAIGTYWERKGQREAPVQYQIVLIALECRLKPSGGQFYELVMMRMVVAPPTHQLQP